MALDCKLIISRRVADWCGCRGLSWPAVIWRLLARTPWASTGLTICTSHGKYQAPVLLEITAHGAW